MFFGNNMLGDEIHAARGWIGRDQLGHCASQSHRQRLFFDIHGPELAMQNAMIEPMAQHQTAVAGPPDPMGAPKVAGTEPSTPRMEIAYDTVDHLVNSLLSSCQVVNCGADGIG